MAGLLCELLYGCNISVGAEPSDDPSRNAGHLGVMPKCFAGMHIGQMHFKNGHVAGAECIPHGNGCVSVGGRIDNYAVGFHSGHMDYID